MVELFAPTLQAIAMIEGQKYITQSLVLLQFCHLDKSIGLLLEKCTFYFIFISHFPIFPLSIAYLIRSNTK